MPMTASCPVESIYTDEKPSSLELYYITGKNAEVLFFSTGLKVTSVSDPVDIFTTKLQ